MLTKEVAEEAGSWGVTFYHVRFKNRDGSPVRCRSNGKCKTWKTRPAEWRLPVKWGLRSYFYITQDTAADWLTEEEYDARTQLGLSPDAPDYAVHDAKLDRQ